MARQNSDTSPQSTKQKAPTLRLARFLKPYAWMLVILAVFTYIQVKANLALPDYMARIINDGIMAKNTGVIYHNGGIMLAITLGGGLCAVVVGYLASRVATSFARDVRNKVFTTVESFSVAEFDTFSTASLITRSTNDIQQIQTATIMIFRLVLMAPFMAFGALQNAVANAPSMSWIIALASGLMILMIATLFIIAIPRFQKIQKTLDRLNLVARENLTGLRVIRAFGTEQKEESKFNDVNLELTGLNLFVNRLMVVLQPMMMLIMNFSMIAIVWFGAHLIDSGDIQVGNMLAFMQYASLVIMSFLMISIMFIMVPRAAVSAKRVAEVIDTKPSITDPENPVKPPANGTGRIEFQAVSFAYPGAEQPVLHDISFSAEPGETTALIGSTGSGKSTLINLIPRFYDATSGNILVDGVDIRAMTLRDLHSQVGYVPQKAVLFSGSIQSNITYGNKHASDAEVQHAAQTAQATEFITKLDKGYQSDIAQGGANVSGGQKQRLAIARALAAKPKVYIFDDSFSAVDFKTDALLRHALATETHDKTVIIVGQRISTIMNAHKIIVLDKGAIVGQGTHAELLKTNPIYREIAYSQLSDEELATVEAAQDRAQAGGTA